MYKILKDIKESLASIESIKSLKIGFEKGADVSSNCPLVRIISEGSITRGRLEDLTVQIVLAFDLKNDVERLYEEFYTLEKLVRDKLEKMPYKVIHIDTVMDGDTLKALKAGIIRYKFMDLYNA